MMQAPKIKSQVTYSVPAHHVLLGFNNDIDAEIFQAWWDIEGLKAFMNCGIGGEDL